MTLEMFLTALIIGLFGGWLAGLVMKAGGHGYSRISRPPSPGAR